MLIFMAIFKSVFGKKCRKFVKIRKKIPIMVNLIFHNFWTIFISNIAKNSNKSWFKFTEKIL